MPELPRRNIGQGRPASSPPDRHAGLNDAAKVAAARAALARAATAHRAGAGNDEGSPQPQPITRNADRDESATVAAAPDESLRPGSRRPPAKWIAIAAAAVAVIIVGVAVTTSGPQGRTDPQVHATQELPQPDVSELLTPGAERSASASAGATASSPQPSAASPTHSGQETQPGTDKAAETDAKPTVSNAPLKKGAGPGDDPAPSPGRALAVESSGNCLTGGGSGAALVVAACTGATTQSWSIGSGTALRQGGLCATTTGTADRTPVVLAPCDQSADQRFSLSGKSLLSTSSGKCLDLFGGAAGTQVVLWECNGRDNQRWSGV